MKNILIYILVLLGFVSCTNKTKNVTDNSTRYYLNKDSIEIIEFENNKIFRYFLRDSIKKELTNNDIFYFSDTEDSLKIVGNDSLIYKKIELNTKDSIDLESSKYWTHKFQNKFQEWYSFRDDVKPNPNYKLYRYYSAVQYQDTIFSSGYSDNGGFRVFDKFNYMFIGKLDDTGGFVSKINDDSLLFIPVNSYSKVVNRPNLYLERYNSIKTNNHIGKWKLINDTICDLSKEVLGNKLKISADSLIFYNNKEITSHFKYILGLDSKYLELDFNNKSDDFMVKYISMSQLKILKINDSIMNLSIRYPRHDFCEKPDTLLYEKIR